jgi:hypothetical protein
MIAPRYANQEIPRHYRRLLRVKEVGEELPGEVALRSEIPCRKTNNRILHNTNSGDALGTWTPRKR